MKKKLFLCGAFGAILVVLLVSWRWPAVYWFYLNWGANNAVKLVEGIENQRLLTYVAETESRSEVRVSAIRRIKDQGTLSHIAQTASDAEMRLSAIASPYMTDQATLREIHGSDPDKRVRIAALQKIDDQKVLKRVAETDNDQDIRLAATRRMTDETMLASIACGQADRSVRVAAAKKVARKDLIARIAELCPDIWPRLRHPKEGESSSLLLAMPPGVASIWSPGVLNKVTLNGRPLSETRLNGEGIAIEAGSHTFRAGYSLVFERAEPVSTTFTAGIGDVCVLYCLVLTQGEDKLWSPSVVCQPQEDGGR